jgi:hypothetical protein
MKLPERLTSTALSTIVGAILVFAGQAFFSKSDDSKIVFNFTQNFETNRTRANLSTSSGQNRNDPESELQNIKHRLDIVETEERMVKDIVFKKITSIEVIAPNTDFAKLEEIFPHDNYTITSDVPLNQPDRNIASYAGAPPQTIAHFQIKKK